MDYSTLLIASLLLGWLLDLLLGDPQWWPHPIVLFGRTIGFFERRLNHGRHRRTKGAVVAISLILLTFAATAAIEVIASRNCWIFLAVNTLLIFSCLAGTTLAEEVRQVFIACDRSIGEGRVRVARIVGRDTSQLDPNEVRTAALETLAENLSDGVVAPLFWLVVLGVPGMLTYKMINTLDSMIGYRTERYRRFGTIAARIDDIANWLPARLTALMMAIVTFRPDIVPFILRYGPRHASPNSGYPEAALAGLLKCRFGGPHIYHGEMIDKPFIGSTDRRLTTADMLRAITINRRVEALAIAIAVAIYIL